jgi:hypothetical protein
MSNILYIVEWSVKILLWVIFCNGAECIGMAREARPPYGVSGKEDRSNMRESIRSENMDRQRALVPSH